MHAGLYSCSIPFEHILYLIVRVLLQPLPRNPLWEWVSSFSKIKGGKKGGTFVAIYFIASANIFLSHTIHKGPHRSQNSQHTEAQHFATFCAKQHCDYALYRVPFYSHVLIVQL